MSSSTSGKVARLARLADSIPLEDELHYVWRKALRGHELSVADLDKRWGISPAAWEAILAGDPSEQATKLATALHLSPTALRHLGKYRPQAPHITAVSRLHLPFEEETVNAWLIREDDHTLLFDTGYGATDALHLLRQIGAADLQLFLTHDHRDHVGGIAALRPITQKQHAIPLGSSISLGNLHIKCLDLAGHCLPSYGYLIEGLSRPLCVVGDALFAGSIGGCPDSFTYNMALRNLRHHVLSLPADTILLPGHGPATTVAQEREHNPFFANAMI
jgi:glyoxylase-like metal-dependent hydrolase (beta-lactamase superfamily II)